MLGLHSSAARSTISMRCGIDSTPSKLIPISSSPMVSSSAHARVDPTLPFGVGIGIGRDARSFWGARGQDSGPDSIVGVEGWGVRGLRGGRGGDMERRAGILLGSGDRERAKIGDGGEMEAGEIAECGAGALGRSIADPWLCRRFSSRSRHRSLRDGRPSPVNMVRRRKEAAEEEEEVGGDVLEVCCSEAASASKWTTCCRIWAPLSRTGALRHMAM